MKNCKNGYMEKLEILKNGILRILKLEKWKFRKMKIR